MAKRDATAPRDAEQIKVLVDKAVEHYQERTDLFSRYLDMYELITEEPAAGQVEIVDTMPHMAVKLAVAIGTRKKPQATLTPNQDTVAERARVARVEQMYHGVRHDLDRQQFIRGRPLWDYEGWLNAMLFGWTATRIVVRKEERGVSPFRFCTHWCPYEVFQGPYGEDGPLWVARRYVEPIQSLVERFPDWAQDENIDPSTMQDPYEMKEVIDFYDDTYNYILVEDKLARPESEHNQGQVPIITVPVGGHNYRGAVGETRSFADTMGMAFIYGMKDMHDYYNELLETLGVIVKKYAYPTVIVKTRDGTLRNIELGAGSVNTMYLEDVVDVIDIPGAPPDVVLLIQSVVQALQRATFQEAIYGTPPQGMSGFGMTLVAHHAGMILEPYMRFMEMYDAEVGRRVLEGIHREKLSSLDLMGTDNQDTPFRLADFSYEELEGQFDIRVERVLSLPEDDLMRAQIAAQLAMGDAPLVSMEYAREKILLIQDPQREKKRIIAEMPYRLPQVVLAMAFQELVDQGDMAAASILGQTLGIQTGGMGPGGGGGGAGPVAGSLPPALQMGQQASPTQMAMQGGQAGQGFAAPMTEFGAL